MQFSCFISLYDPLLHMKRHTQKFNLVHLYIFIIIVVQQKYIQILVSKFELNETICIVCLRASQRFLSSP
jgi:hypothetical protein